MAYRYHGRAQVSRSSPQAWGICDRCNFTYLLADLRYQYQYNGTQLYNTNLRVCDRCMDEPQPQFLNPILPPDPMPVMNPRPPAYSVQEAGPTQQITAEFLSDITQLPSTLYLDLLDGSPSQGGVSVITAISGSGRIDVSSNIQQTGAFATNTQSIAVTPKSLASENVSWMAIYDASTGGSLVMATQIAVPQTVVLYNGLTIPQGGIIMALQNYSGYDVYLQIGQSNEEGNGIAYNASLDTTSPRIQQWAATGPNANAISLAQEPLWGPAGQKTDMIGHALAFGRDMLPYTNVQRNIMLVPRAVGGAAFRFGSWQAAASKAEMVITCLGTGVAGQTITIAGTTCTLVASGATGNQINVGATSTELASNLAAWINANTVTLGCNATTGATPFPISNLGSPSIVGLAAIKVEANATGTAGNSVTLAQTGATYPTQGFLFGAFTSNLSLVGGTASRATLLTNAINAANAALASTPGSRLAGILWLQGESDLAFLSEDRYRQDVLAVLAAIRANVTGAANAPFLVGCMVPEYVATLIYGDTINLAHKTLPIYCPYVGMAQPVYGSLPTANFHYDAPTQRTMGSHYVTALLQSLGNTTLTPTTPPSAPTGLSLTSAGQFQMTVSWSWPTSGQTRVTSGLLEYKRAVDSSWTSVPLESYDITATIPNLIAGVSYNVRVTGINEAGSGTSSALLTASTLPFQFLLDELNVSAAFAFSFVKLRSSYSGDCIRVRRSSDSAETDIGFANNMLDTETLLAFAGTDSAYITIPYDQSGNGINPVQATAARQWRIVNAGVLETSVSGAVGAYAKYDGTNPQFYESTTGFPLGTDFSKSTIITQTTGSGTMHMIGPTSTSNHSLGLDHRPYLYVGGAVATSSTSLPASGSPQVVGASYTLSSKNGRVYVGGAQVASGAGTAFSPTGAGFQIGTFQSLGTLQFNNGWFHEAIIFGFDATSAQQLAIYNHGVAQYGAT